MFWFACSDCDFIIVSMEFFILLTKPCTNIGVPLPIRDMFHVYLNIFEFLFLRLYINKASKLCFFVYNGRVSDITK